MDYTELVKAFGAFFALMNPFINLPIFLAFTEGLSVAEQRTLAVKVIFFSAVMSGIILVAGENIISFFGITIDQFRIAGGAVLAHISWSMVNGQTIASHEGSNSEKKQIVNMSELAFFPITFPMIVGPGTIATLIIYRSSAKDIEGVLALGGLLVIIFAILFIVLFFASFFSKIFSNTMRMIMTRLMGMVLLSIAVEMIVDGIRAVLPALA